MRDRSLLLLMLMLMSIPPLSSAMAVASDEGGDYPAVIAHERPMIGLYPSDVPAPVAEREGLPAGTGVFVVGIIPGTAAERMGLRDGDVILTFNGQPVSSYAEIVAARDRYIAGDVADIRFSRGGIVIAASAPLGSWSSAGGRGPRPSPPPEIDQALVDRLRELVASVERAHPELAEPDAASRERLVASSAAIASGAWSFTAGVVAPASTGADAPPRASVEVPAADRADALVEVAPARVEWRLEWRSGAR